jgi:hypothetical protein
VDGERCGELHHLAAVVDADDLAPDLRLDVAEEDASTAPDVEEPVVGLQVERREHVRPGEVVGRRRRVCLARLPAVRPTRDAIGHPIDPPLAEPVQHVRGV